MTNSIFQDGFLNKIINKQFSENFYLNLLSRILFTILFLWFPIYYLNQDDVNTPLDDIKFNYAYDYASIVQLLVVIPLYLTAVTLLKGAWSNIFTQSMLLLVEEEQQQFKQDFQKWIDWTYSHRADSLIVFSALVIPISTLWVEYQSKNESWYIVPIEDSHHITLAGYYAWFISIPIFLTVTLYVARMVLTWVAYLYIYSKKNFQLNALHPDNTYGLKFLVLNIQSFSILVFTQGLVQISTIIYKIEVQNEPIEHFNILALALSYTFFAPLVVILPLLFFTKKMFHEKNRQLRTLNETVHEFLSKNSISIDDYITLKELREFYEQLNGLRVWPIDIISISRLLLSSILPMLPAIIHIFQIPIPTFLQPFLMIG